MCGIAGAYYFKGLPPNPAKRTAALASMRLRGPDDEGQWSDARLWLGHRRLAILDVSPAGRQPFIDDTQKHVLSFNGEIFNYIELIPRLKEKNLVTRSDTEVLFKLLIQAGAEVLPELNGFFALSFYSVETGRLLLARDPLGEKPLYYYHDAEKFLFASELTALIALGVPQEVNPAALTTFFRLQYLPPDVSMLKNVQKLPPGAYLTLESNGVATIKPYYILPESVPYPPPRGENFAKGQEEANFANSPPAKGGPGGENFTEACAGFRTRLTAAVERRLRADVPVGVFLSGGMDSAVVALLARQIRPDITAFTLAFDDPRFDESGFALQTARAIGVNCTPIRLSLDTLAERAAALLERLDEPFADSSAINFYALSVAAREHITVALTGDGADELLAGYVKHYGEYRARNAGFWTKGLTMLGRLARLLPHARLAYRIRKFADAARLSPTERFLRWASVRSDDELRALLTNFTSDAALLAPYLPSTPDFNDVLKADLRLTLPGDMLVKADRASMAASLEARPPFLDTEVVDYVCRLPATYKIGGGVRKRLLRAAFAADLPPELFRRPKRGFETPLRALLLGPLRAIAENALKEIDVFRPQALARLWKTVEQNPPAKEEQTLWAAVVYAVWTKRTNATLGFLHEK